MSLLEKTKSLLRTYRVSPNKLLGQNFTIDASILQRVVDHAFLKQDDVVLDVGAGFGFLTRLLAVQCQSVVAVEADETIAKVLRQQLGDLSNVEIVEDNILKTQVPSFSKVVSIPPYRISSKLLIWLFSKESKCAVFVFQKEFANRLVASVGSEDYGWLAVLAYYYVETELLDEVSKRAFYPEPQVSSIIVRLTPKRPKPFAVKDEALFKRLVQSLFTSRNRKIRSAILPYLKGILGMTQEDASAQIGRIPFQDRRTRELSPEDIGELANALNE
jgi:16S rRNA (adenine1518-N6/adenine1519-N6)-dimethyltransferase